MSLKGAVTVGPEAPLVLTAGKNSNLPKWTKSTFLRMQEKFGRIANVMKTDKPHEIPPLEPSDYTPPGDHGLSENAIMAIQVDHTKTSWSSILNSMRRYYKVCLLSRTILSRGTPTLQPTTWFKTPTFYGGLSKKPIQRIQLEEDSCRSCATK